MNSDGSHRNDGGTVDDASHVSHSSRHGGHGSHSNHGNHGSHGSPSQRYSQRTHGRQRHASYPSHSSHSPHTLEATQSHLTRGEEEQRALQGGEEQSVQSLPSVQSVQSEQSRGNRGNRSNRGKDLAQSRAQQSAGTIGKFDVVSNYYDSYYEQYFNSLDDGTAVGSVAGSGAQSVAGSTKGSAMKSAENAGSAAGRAVGSAVASTSGGTAGSTSGRMSTARSVKSVRSTTTNATNATNATDQSEQTFDNVYSDYGDGTHRTYPYQNYENYDNYDNPRTIDEYKTASSASSSSLYEGYEGYRNYEPNNASSDQSVAGEYEGGGVAGEYERKEEETTDKSNHAKMGGPSSFVSPTTSEEDSWNARYERKLMAEAATSAPSAPSSDAVANGAATSTAAVETASATKTTTTNGAPTGKSTKSTKLITSSKTEKSMKSTETAATEPTAPTSNSSDSSPSSHFQAPEAIAPTSHEYEAYAQKLEVKKRETIDGRFDGDWNGEVDDRVLEPYGPYEPYESGVAGGVGSAGVAGGVGMAGEAIYEGNLVMDSSYQSYQSYEPCHGLRVVHHSSIVDTMDNIGNIGNVAIGNTGHTGKINNSMASSTLGALNNGQVPVAFPDDDADSLILAESAFSPNIPQSNAVAIQMDRSNKGTVSGGSGSNGGKRQDRKKILMGILMVFILIVTGAIIGVGIELSRQTQSASLESSASPPSSSPNGQNGHSNGDVSQSPPTGGGDGIDDGSDSRGEGIEENDLAPPTTILASASTVSSPSQIAASGSSGSSASSFTGTTATNSVLTTMLDYDAGGSVACHAIEVYAQLLNDVIMPGNRHRVRHRVLRGDEGDVTDFLANAMDTIDMNAKKGADSITAAAAAGLGKEEPSTLVEEESPKSLTDLLDNAGDVAYHSDNDPVTTAGPTDDGMITWSIRDRSTNQDRASGRHPLMNVMTSPPSPLDPDGNDHGSIFLHGTCLSGGSYTLTAQYSLHSLPDNPGPQARNSYPRIQVFIHSLETNEYVAHVALVDETPQSKEFELAVLPSEVMEGTTHPSTAAQIAGTTVVPTTAAAATTPSTTARTTTASSSLTTTTSTTTTSTTTTSSTTSSTSTTSTTSTTTVPRTTTTTSRSTTIRTTLRPGGSSGRPGDIYDGDQGDTGDLEKPPFFEEEHDLPQDDDTECYDVSFEITTDNRGRDNSAKIVNFTSSQDLQYEDLIFDRRFQPNQFFELDPSYCLTPSEYVFVVEDDQGNGIKGEGFTLKVTSEGSAEPLDLIIREENRFGRRDLIHFPIPFNPFNLYLLEVETEPQLNYYISSDELFWTVYEGNDLVFFNLYSYGSTDTYHDAKYVPAGDYKLISHNLHEGVMNVLTNDQDYDGRFGQTPIARKEAFKNGSFLSVSLFTVSFSLPLPVREQRLLEIKISTWNYGDGMAWELQRNGEVIFQNSDYYSGWETYLEAKYISPGEYSVKVFKNGDVQGGSNNDFGSFEIFWRGDFVREYSASPDRTVTFYLSLE